MQHPPPRALEPTRFPVTSRPAFTFVEMIIVVLIIGIIAAVSVGRFTDIHQGAVETSLSVNLKVMRDQLDRHSFENGYPNTLDPGWFCANCLPEHPQNRAGVPTLQTADVPGKLNPSRKVLESSVQGAYWYNSAEGVIRARVAPLGTAKETLELYNKVNGTRATGLGNYSGGGAS